MNRKTFPWDKTKWNQDLHDFVRELITIRHSMPVLRTGSYEPVFTEGQVIAYLRREYEEKVLVVINADDRSQTVSLHLNGAFADQTILQDQIGKGNFTVENNALNHITIPAQSGLILA